MARLRTWEKNMERLIRSKAELRSIILEKRKYLTEEMRTAWDEAVLCRLKSLAPSLFPGKDGCVYGYVSVRRETGTDAILSWCLKEGIRIALPRVTGRDMTFYFITGREQLVPGAFCIPEPAPDCEPACVPQAPVLVPGVAFSYDGGRLGYGAGYYDRFLAREPDHETIGLCYEFQLTEGGWEEHHDVKIGRIITPDRLLESDRNCKTWEKFVKE